MVKATDAERRLSDRFVIAFPVQLEWDDESGSHIVETGTTENIGLEGTLVHLPRSLPRVGSSVNLRIYDADDGEAEMIRVDAQVLRLERNAAHPLAALRLTDSIETWRESVWQSAALKIAELEADTYED